MFTAAKSNGLSVTAYLGDGSVLLGFDLDDDKVANLAGFSVQCTTPDSGPYPTNEYWLPNSLNFQGQASGQGQPVPPKASGSNVAPLQTFHWVHFPSAGPGQYQYAVYPSYFKNGQVSLGQGVTLPVNLQYREFPSLEVGFTRGYISSQAYADRFANQEIRPMPKTMDYDTTPYLQQYQWLGAHARQLVFEFLQECQSDPTLHVDMFAFDFDEPDIIKAVASMGSRVRLFQDDSSEHTGPGTLEPQTVSALQKAGVAVEQGHFARFAHDKVLIQTRNGSAVKVLTGSANFSVRGLYVQANSVLTFDDVRVAGLYEQAFQQAFQDENAFTGSSIASQWYDVSGSGLPNTSFSFAPHTTPFSLQKVGDAITAAKSSVMFAIMQMEGTGPVMTALEGLGSRSGIFAIGTIQQESQLQLFKPGIDPDVAFTSFSFLQNNVPEPFKQEWSGDPGQVIHHKFVVCDFNQSSPVVFCGSSNLAAGGETSNGDNLLAITDPEIATLYAVEAVRLFDHFNFRRLQEHATDATPMVLDSTDNWTKPYYDPSNIKFVERKLFSSPTQTS